MIFEFIAYLQWKPKEISIFHTVPRRLRDWGPSSWARSSYFYYYINYNFDHARNFLSWKWSYSYNLKQWPISSLSNETSKVSGSHAKGSFTNYVDRFLDFFDPPWLTALLDKIHDIYLVTFNKPHSPLLSTEFVNEP